MPKLTVSELLLLNPQFLFTASIPPPAPDKDFEDLRTLVKVSDKSALPLSISNINIRLHGHRRNSRCVLQYILQFPMEIN